MALALNNHHMTTREIHHGRAVSNGSIRGAGSASRADLLAPSAAQLKTTTTGSPELLLNLRYFRPLQEEASLCRCCSGGFSRRRRRASSPTD